MLEKLVVVMAVILLVGGCTSGLLMPRQGETETVLETPEELKAVLIDVLKGAKETAEETQWYQTGEGVATGIFSLLGALGIGGFALERKKRKGTENALGKTSRELNDVTIGLRAIEEAIMTAGDKGKVVTGNIKKEGAYTVAAVDKARSLAHNHIY